MNRALYFSIPEQKIIYHAVKMYIEKNPGLDSADDILRDFYKETFDR